MTKIDFYTAASPQQLLACRVIEKAWRKQLHVVVQTQCAASAAQLDDYLWEFRPNALIPHALQGSVDAANADVIITHSELAQASGPPERCDVLVNLSNLRPAHFASYLRLAEIVSNEAEDKAQSRERYQYYRERGYPLNYHQL